MKRTILALRNKQGQIKYPKFADCLLDFFGNGINSVIVSCSVEDGVLVLNESREGCELRHSPKCPVRLSANSSIISEELHRCKLSDVEISLASSVAIESSDSHILLTRRAPHMRVSPNSWVLPGGHLEYGETVFEAGIRETKEETALDITTEKSSILGIWENVYPLFLGLGTPKHHTAVVYLHIRLDETHEELTKRIIPDPTEVVSYCWLNAEVTKKLFIANKTEQIDGKQYVFQNGKIVESYLNYNNMFNTWTWTQPHPFSGVNFAVRKWVERVNSRTQKSKF